MAEIKITQKRNNSTEIIISGELTIYCAVDFYQQHIKAIKLKPLTILYLSDIDEVDTAGVQLLIMLFKEISRQQSQCQINSISRALQDYSNIFRLDHYFTLHGSDNEPTTEISSEGQL
ncbi:MAG: STAS domain-containing protein [Colwellia sp.]|nr:STAS domain-containing protein [Colwellia sp.]